MTAIDVATPRVQLNEGFRALPYKDTGGHLTVGYGANLDAGITQYCALALLDAQLEELQTELLKFSWYSGLDPVRQSVPLEIAFNAGLHGLLGYPHMIAALSVHDWTLAATHCTTNNQKLASRYEALSRILATGDA